MRRHHIVIGILIMVLIAGFVVVARLPSRQFFSAAAINPPVVPAGLSITNANTAQPTISWNAQAGATYAVWFINVTKQKLISRTDTLTTNSFTTSAKLEPGRYRLWVRARNSIGMSNWSPAIAFDIVPPVVPTGFSVANAATGLPVISWNALPDASSYAVWFINVTTQKLISRTDTLTTNSFTPTAPLEPGRYRLWARAKNAAGTSGWSSAFEVTVDAPPTYPFFPRGIYWAGETTYNEETELVRWTRIEERIGVLAADGFNTIWITHMPCADIARFARIGVKYQVRVVASCGELAGDVQWNREGNHQAMITQALNDWGDAPRPLAWGLGDEPREAYVDQMQRYVDAWRQFAPDEPITTVVMWGDVEAYSRLGFDFLTNDVYPFFMDPAAAYPTTPYGAWNSLTAKNARLNPGKAWMMSQGFRELQWAMPDARQVSWQTWAGVANGARGIFTFLLRWPGNPSDALLNEDDSPTPQYAALSKAAKALKNMESVLGFLEPDPSVFVALDRPAVDSSLVRGFIDPNVPQSCYIVAVAGYESSGDIVLKLLLGPDILSLQRFSDKTPVPVNGASGLRTATMILPAGTGELLECSRDPANKPQVYTDDFRDDKVLTDTVHGGVQTYPFMLNGRVLSASSGVAWPVAFFEHDLDARFGVAPAGLRALLYNQWSLPQPPTRGVQWRESPDGTSWSVISQNQNDTAVALPSRFVRGSPSWAGGGDYLYGFLNNYALYQWTKQ